MNSPVYTLTRPERQWCFEAIAIQAHVDLAEHLIAIWRDWQRAAIVVGQRP